MKHAWVVEALRARGLTQRDLAQRWQVSEGAVSRWLSGQERQDLPMSRAMSLSRLLGMELEELAARLGFRGESNLPAVLPTAAQTSAIPVGTSNWAPTGAGRARILLHLDVSPELAGQLMTLIMKGA